MKKMNYAIAARQLSVRNLTPHAVTIVKDDGSTVVYQPEPVPARVDTILEMVREYPVPLFEETYGEVQGLPKPVYGTILIVSGQVVSACPDRIDLVHPVGLVRDDQGRVIGCRGLAPNQAYFDWEY